MAKTNAEIFCQNIPQSADAAAYTYIEGLIGDPDSEENAWRDYKTADWIDGSAVADKPLKELWSENLSAFANSGGGVLIFGLQTKGNRPHTLSLAQDAAALRDRLLELVNNATDPYVGKVEARAIPKPGSLPALYPDCSRSGLDKRFG